MQYEHKAPLAFAKRNDTRSSLSSFGPVVGETKQSQREPKKANNLHANVMTGLGVAQAAQAAANSMYQSHPKLANKAQFSGTSSDEAVTPNAKNNTEAKADAARRAERAEQAPQQQPTPTNDLTNDLTLTHANRPTNTPTPRPF